MAVLFVNLKFVEWQTFAERFDLMIRSMMVLLFAQHLHRSGRPATLFIHIAWSTVLLCRR